jgi:regulator of replication initiation timing
MRTRDWYSVLLSAMLAGLLTWPAVGFGQETTRGSEPSLSETVKELQAQIRELRAAVDEVRTEARQYRAETTELRKELAAVRGTRDGAAPETAAPSSAVAGQTESATTRKQERAASLEEQYQMLAGKIDEQYQTKVESASKYRVRLSGIVLVNLFGNQGTVDNIDFPAVVYDRAPGSSDGSFGASLRQSQIGLEVFGPQVAGARTKADIQFDFAGGFSRVPNGVNAGLLRLRTGTIHFDWGRTSVVAGQDGVFFSPQSPTSFATLAEPALSYAGNLWAWVPQVRVEHRFSTGEESTLLVQGGILDGQSGEAPQLSGYRQPLAGERSRVPAFASRVAWSRTIFGQPLRVGAGGYYGRQDYGFGRNVDAWAGTADWELPLGRQFSLSGELYRGRALGGVGGGIWRSVLFSGDPGAIDTQVRALNTAGGWAQLEYRATSKLEFHGAFGEDAPYRADLRAFPSPQAYGDPTLTKNQGTLLNVIYRPRSDLLLSAEYRHLKTYTSDNGTYSADHVNLTMGVLF